MIEADPWAGRCDAIQALYPRNPDVLWLLEQRRQLLHALDDAVVMLTTAAGYDPGELLDRAEQLLGRTIPRCD